MTFKYGSRSATLKVEVASTPAARAQGLSNRQSLPPDSGMLFEWDQDTLTMFWMKDTTTPLSIAFVGSDMRVIVIKDLKPFDLTPVGPPISYRYAVETNRGWFASHGVTAGSTMTLNL